MFSLPGPIKTLQDQRVVLACKGEKKNSFKLFSYQPSNHTQLGGNIVDNIKMKPTIAFRGKMPYHKLKKIIQIVRHLLYFQA
jgi:hypothetical protein